MKKTIIFLTLILINLQSSSQSYSLYEKYIGCYSNADLSIGKFYPAKQIATDKYITILQLNAASVDTRIALIENNFSTFSDYKILGGSGYDLGNWILKTQRPNRHLLYGYSTSQDGELAYAAQKPYCGFNWLQLYDDSFNVIASCLDIIDTTADVFQSYPHIVQSKNMDYYFVSTIDSGSEIFSHTKVVPDIDDAFILAFDSMLKFKWKYFFVGDAECNSDKSDFDVASIGYDKVAVVLSTNSTNSELLGNQAKGGKDIFVAILDSAGNLITSKRYGGSKDELSPTMQYDEQSNRLLIASSSYSKDGDVWAVSGTDSASSNAWVLVLDTAGNIIKSRAFGTDNNLGKLGPTYFYGTFVSSSELIDNEFWIYGTANGGGGDFGADADTFRNVFVMVVDADANLQGIKEIGGELDDRTYANTPTFSNFDNDMVIYGTSQSLGNTDTFNSFGGCTIADNKRFFFAVVAKAPLQIDEPSTIKNGITLYPNPTNHKVTIDIEHKENYKNISATLYSFDGRILAQQDVFTNPTFDLGNYSPGVYFINCKLDDDIIIQKVMKY